MKIKVILAVLLLACGTTAMAQQKVVDKSGKKPAWAANMLEKDFLVTSGDGATQADAQQQAMLKVKQEMARAVAENISSTGTLKKGETNGEITSDFSSVINSKVSKIADIQGVSISKAEAYWEKLEDKKTKQLTFRYYVKYPFSASDMNRLVTEYKREDKKLTDRLDELEQGVETVPTVEGIDAAIVELTSLKGSFDDKRADRAQMLIGRYKTLYSAIKITDMGSTAGNVKYVLQLGERSIGTSQKPNVKSECATVVNIQSGATANLVIYTYDGCYADVENFVDVSYRFGGATCSKKFYIDVNEGVLKLQVQSPLTVKGGTVSVTLDAASITPFVVEGMDLSVLGKKTMVSAKNAAEFSGKGNHAVVLNFDADVASQVKSQGLASGSIRLLNKKTGERTTLKFSSVQYVVVK